MRRMSRQSLLSLPSLGISMLPKLACPACWPAYAGLLSSIGLGFLMSAAYLFPLTVLFLSLAVGALAFRAKKRYGYGPFWMGLLAAIAVLSAKFVWESNAAMYGALGLLIVASVWNSWPGRAPSSDQRCPECDRRAVQ